MGRWYADAAFDIPDPAGEMVPFRISANVSLAQTHDGPLMPNKHSLLLVTSLYVGTFCCQLLAADTEPPSQLQVVRTDDGYEFLEGQSPVLFYQTAPKSLDDKFERAGYVHPLYDLDGNVISEDFPADHLHHRGIFWAWHQLVVDGNQIGDPWICRDFLSRVDNVKIAESNSDAAAIEATARWVSPDWKDSSGDLKPIVREETRIEVRNSRDGSRVIDFRIKLTALEPEVRIGGSDDVKGYGGFSPRLRLPKDIRFTAEYGDVEPQRTAVEASRWMDISGTFNKQKGDRKDSIDGVTILCHPSLPRFPQQWILRKARSMQNPVFPGRSPIALPTKEPLELRYRLIVHRGTTSQEQLKLWFDEYAAEE
ncbi:MAG: DUF6807 domain-containing protein [Planctomycetales bacterium]